MRSAGARGGRRSALVERDFTAGRGLAPRPILLASFALLLLVLGTFSPVIRNSFIELDDPHYVFLNPHVRAGFTLEGVRWAFRSFEQSNWHPLTWLSHMMDAQFFGMQPGWHHFSSLALHLAAVVLLFLVLNRMTGSTHRAFLVAALFGLHPLRVESVAWVAERKDVLSAFFFMIGLGTYLRYVGRPGPARYLQLVLAFGLGLISKPMLVTFPCVLLLLDFWPLGRFGPTRTKPLLFLLLWEKAPLWALSAASGIVTFLAQQSGGVVKDLTAYPFSVRLANAALSYLVYLGKMVWPVRLSFPYPHPGYDVPIARAATAAMLLLLASLLILRAWRRPYLATGWYWFIGMLLPVIGLIQVADQGLADRYTYLPMAGLLVAVVWALADALPPGLPVRNLASALAILALMPLTHAQTRRWKDSLSLFSYVASLNPENVLAQINLGAAYSARGSLPEAAACFEKALRLNPNQAEAHRNLALVYSRMARVQEAKREFLAALAFSPDDARTRHYFAELLARSGDVREAVRQYTAALEVRPDNPRTYLGLGLAQERLGRREEAERSFREALRLDPNLTAARERIAVLQSERRRP